MKKGEIKFGIVGAGWRAEFYLRLARACPNLFEVTGVTSRNEEKRQGMSEKWGVAAFMSVQEMLEKSDPLFVVTCVPWDANPGIIMELAAENIPVLSETPPAPDINGLIELNELDARIQVAEQYPFQPHHAARITVVRNGKLGNVSQAQVSSAHGYHGISLIRRLLGITFENAEITASRFSSPLINGPDRSGPPLKEELKESVQEFFRFDFEDKLGILDFTGAQYFSWIRNERVLIRGERGEIVNKEVSYLKDFTTPVTHTFVRHAAGVDGNLEGNYLKGIQLGDEWVYANPFIPAALTDDEIAIGTCLLKMMEYMHTGKDFYSLAEASQDQYLSLMCGRALEKNERITTERMPWADSED